MQGNFLNIPGPKDFERAKKILKRNKIEFDEYPNIFAGILWSEEDITAALKESDVSKPTEEQVILVRDAVDTENLEERSTERGWEFVYDAVREVTGNAG